MNMFSNATGHEVIRALQERRASLRQEAEYWAAQDLATASPAWASAIRLNRKHYKDWLERNAAVIREIAGLVEFDIPETYPWLREAFGPSQAATTEEGVTQ